MKYLLPIKIIVLLAALVGVFYAIHRVNSGSMEHAFQVLGIQEGNGNTPGFQPAHRAIQPGEVAFNICPNRVKAVVWSDRKVEELRNGMKVSWMAYDPAARELGYLAVEKWFSNHCQIFVTPEPDAVGNDGKMINDPADHIMDFVVIRYIDGSEMQVQRDGTGLFIAKRAGETTRFRSSDFPDALKELGVLAQFAPGPSSSGSAPVAKPTPKLMRATVTH